MLLVDIFDAPSEDVEPAINRIYYDIIYLCLQWKWWCIGGGPPANDVDLDVVKCCDISTGFEC